MATEWYEDGQIKSEVEFKNGNRHGRTQRWDQDGNIELDLLFEDGEPIDPSATANKESPAAEPTLDKNNESQSPDSSPNGESTPEKTNP